MVRYLKEKLDLLKLASKIKSLEKENRRVKAENEILKSALRMREESGKKNAAFPQKSLKY